MLLAEVARSGARFSGIRIHAALDADGTLTKRGVGESPHLWSTTDCQYPARLAATSAPKPSFPSPSAAPPASPPRPGSVAATPSVRPQALTCCAICEVVATVVAGGVREDSSGWLGYGDDATGVDASVEP